MLDEVSRVAKEIRKMKLVMTTPKSRARSELRTFLIFHEFREEPVSLDSPAVRISLPVKELLDGKISTDEFLKKHETLKIFISRLQDSNLAISNSDFYHPELPNNEAGLTTFHYVIAPKGRDKTDWNNLLKELVPRKSN